MAMTKPNALKFTLFTQTRDSLWESAVSLFSAMPSHLFEDPNHPVVITVRGGYNSGKTIFLDAARETLIPLSFCHAKSVLGCHRLDEYYEGIHEGQPFELTFLNASANNLFLAAPSLQRTFNRKGEMEVFFMGLRRHGGVAFIHNSDDIIMESSIDIWLEDGVGSLESTVESSRLHLSENGDIKTLFQSSEQSWNRYIDVSVFDRRLLKNESFIDSLKGSENLKKIGTVMQHYPKPSKPTIL